MTDSVRPSAAGGSSPDVSGAPNSPPQPIARNVVTELVGTTLVMLAGPGAIVLSGGAIRDLAVAVSFGVAMAICDRRDRRGRQPDVHAGADAGP